MKIKSRSTIFLAGLLLAGTSCQQNSETKESETSTADHIFVARPVPVPKQEVKTLEIGQPAADFRLISQIRCQ